MRQPQMAWIVGATLFAALACTSGRSAMNASADTSELENVEWKLIELDGMPVPAPLHGAPTMTLSSKDHRAHGFAGCNRFFGGYDVNGGKLRFTGLAATRMACPEPTPEPALLKALEDTASWKVDGRILELFDATPVLRARWTVTAIESGG